MNVRDIVITSWTKVATDVACRSSEFVGQGKETRVFRLLADRVREIDPRVRTSGPDMQMRFGKWSIDLVFSCAEQKLAVEGKYKIRSDGGVPDSRKAAFFDLYKLERYVEGNDYTMGLFLWLTDEPSYLKQANGDSADFSTHSGRVYVAGVPLTGWCPGAS